MERLDKLVADRTMCGRKEAKEMIRRGLVLVDGRVAKRPEQKCGSEMVVEVAGERLEMAPLLYLMLNKPQGVLSATRDPRAPTVLNLVPAFLQRKGLFPAGRLDKNTEGLLIITDDGAFAHRMLSPRNRIPKTYQARLDKPGDFAQIKEVFAQGIDLGDGDKASPSQLQVLENSLEPLVELVIYEGAYHQVKRMFALFELQVTALRRVTIGSLNLDPTLQPGECRQLTAVETALLLTP